MSNEIRVNNTTPEQLTETILTQVKKEFEILKQFYTPREPEDFLSRKETAELLKISLVCLHSWVNQKILKSYKMGNKTFFSRKEVTETMFNSNK